MGYAVTLQRPGVVGLAPYDEEPLPDDGVRLRTLYSGISAGTELASYRGSSPYLSRRWDSGQRLFVEGTPSLGYPLDSWGYEEVGEVAEIGAAVDGVRRGALVWGAWGHRSTAVVTGEWARQHQLHDSIPALSGIFARMGAIALNAVLEADIHLGETVAVFGLGVPGLLCCQLVRLNGGRVVGVDTERHRLDLATRLGAVATVDAGETSPGEEIRRRTGGLGADVTIELSGSHVALHEAIRATAYSSRVISSGFMQGEARGLRLGEEFHHNRIQLVCSQISGVPPTLVHRWSRARLETTFLELLAGGEVVTEPLVTHVVPARDAAEAFAMLDDRGPATLQVVLQFADAAG